MKKIYLQPTTKVVMFKSRNYLMAGSPDPKFDPNSGTGTMGARRGDIDFDDFDEEY